jgi:hypothetical protein
VEGKVIRKSIAAYPNVAGCVERDGVRLVLRLASEGSGEDNLPDGSSLVTKTSLLLATMIIRLPVTYVFPVRSVAMAAT